MLLEISPDLKHAYELKELYRDFNKRCPFEETSVQLDYLIELFGQSNALAENINQKLWLLIEVSNGYTNLERFRARALYCLNDKLFYCLTICLYSRKREYKTWYICQTNCWYIKQIKSNYTSIFSKKGYLSHQLWWLRYPYFVYDWPTTDFVAHFSQIHKWFSLSIFTLLIFNNLS